MPREATTLERPSLMRAIVSPQPARSAVGSSDPLARLPGEGSAQDARAASAAGEQLDFDWQFGHSHPLLFVNEVAELFDISDRAVRDRCEEGRLVAFAINAEEQPKRERLRILRASAQHGIQHTASGIADLIRTVGTGTSGGWLLRHSRQTLTVRDIAAALRITGEHVRQLYNAQQLQAFHAGKENAAAETLRFHRASLITFVTRRLMQKNHITEL